MGGGVMVALPLWASVPSCSDDNGYVTKEMIDKLLIFIITILILKN